MIGAQSLGQMRPGQGSVPVSMAPPYATALGRPPAMSSFSPFNASQQQPMGTPFQSQYQSQMQARPSISQSFGFQQLGSQPMDAGDGRVQAFASFGYPQVMQQQASTRAPSPPPAASPLVFKSGEDTLAIARQRQQSPPRQPAPRQPSPPREAEPSESILDRQDLGQLALVTKDDQAWTDGTTGLKGCSMTLPKYSKRLQGTPGDAPIVMDRRQANESPRPSRSARSGSPRLSDRVWVPGGRAGVGSESDQRPQKRRSSPQRQSIAGLQKQRAVDKCHADLYMDAFARQQRLREMQQHVEQAQTREEKKRINEYNNSMKEWKRLYKMKDNRTQAERSEDLMKRRKDKETRALEAERQRELAELRSCTFKPTLKKKLAERARSPRGKTESFDQPSSLSQLLERQQCASASLQELNAEDLRLREHLASVHAEYHDRIQREETQRVVVMLQDADSEGSAQRDLIDRVRRMVAAGDDPEVAQRTIVEELVARSQDEVKRRVLDAFGPIQLEAEGKLYNKRLALVHELESIEAQVVALKGGTLVQEARDLGFEFGFADKMRQTLPAVPVLSAMKMTASCDNYLHPPSGVHFRSYSTGSSKSTPRHSPRHLSDRNALRPSTPRSQTATSDGPSRQSSLVLQPAPHEGADRRVSGDAEALEASLLNNSSVHSLHSDSRAGSGQVPDQLMASVAAANASTASPGRDEASLVQNGSNASLGLGANVAGPEAAAAPTAATPNVFITPTAPMTAMIAPQEMPLSAESTAVPATGSRPLTPTSSSVGHRPVMMMPQQVPQQVPQHSTGLVVSSQPLSSGTSTPRGLQAQASQPQFVSSQPLSMLRPQGMQSQPLSGVQSQPLLQQAYMPRAAQMLR